MKKVLLSVLLMLTGCLFFNCKEQNKKIIIKKPTNNKEKKLVWQDMPQYKKDGFIEVMEGRTVENQKILESIYNSELGEDQEFNEENYRIEEINLMNYLFYRGLKSSGFRFPSEEVFARQVKEVFGVDIDGDYSNNPRIKKIENYLILQSKVYNSDKYKKTPLLYFNNQALILDLTNRYYFDFNVYSVHQQRDDFDQVYYTYGTNSLDLSLNNFIFYNSQAALTHIYYSWFHLALIEKVGYDNFPSAYDNVFKKIQRDCMQEYKEASARTREGWDYRMYDRLFFSRGFDGKLKVKKKMLAAAVELAQEEEAYIQVPLDYYFIQMTTDYIANEYAAADGEVNNYFKECEPYYTPEERAMIWVYTALLELNIPPKSNRQTPYDFISLATQYPNLYEVAKAHDFFGEDMQEVLDYLQ